MQKGGNETARSEKRWVRPLIRLLMLVCAAGALCSAFVLFSDSREYEEGNRAYRQVRQAGKLPASGANRAGAAERASGGEPAETQAEPEAVRPDFAALKRINPDVVAWLTLGGTEIDYPVVRGKDNSYYLRHLFTGEQNKLGTIFMDCRNSGNFSGRNTVLYGHNMKDGSMFAALEKYKDQSYYDRFPSMMLDTPGGDLRIDLFAGVVVNGDRQSVPLGWESDRAFTDYVDSLKRASTFRSGTAVDPGDRIVTLCTCSYEYSDARYAVYGRLTPVK